MANCRACGGVLGLDCFNESDCMQISVNNQYHQDTTIEYLELYISVLEYKLKENNLTIPLIESPVNPLVIKQVFTCENNPMIDFYLPF